jgi:hypothetical protein
MTTIQQPVASRPPYPPRPPRSLFPGLPGLLACVLAACASEAPPAAEPSDDVIRMMGHGQFLGDGWKRLEPSRDLFERTQHALLERLTAEARVVGVDVDAAITRFAAQHADRMLANAALIDWLLDEAPPGDHATIRSVNAAMRGEYVATLPPGTAGADTIARVTFNGGQKYIDECQALGVPIPPPMYRTGPGNWQPRGSLSTNFLGMDAQLWEYRTDNGICLALPRYDSEKGPAKLFGLICLATGAPSGATNKACFWDNPKGVYFPRNVEVPLTSFVGGYDLQANAQGVCSDCHAGANPFIVHPQDPAFATIAYRDQTPTGWYEPIVHSSWPQNRGPSNLLAGVALDPGDASCATAGCHARATEGGVAGQFPILSNELPGYCGTVLGRAAGIFGGMPETMPPGLMNLAAYEKHRDALRDACQRPPDTGKVVGAPPGGKPQFLSPPTLQGVAYDCAQTIEVNNVALHAVVTVTVNGTSYTQTANNVHHITFTLSAPLAVGDVITAVQSIGGMTSAPSTLVVRDHWLDYPMGLPAPTINPELVHECADVISVAHVPGSTVTVYSSAGTSPVGGAGASGWTAFWPGSRPFIVGDTFQAEQKLCPTEPTSPMSDVVTAVSAPSTLPVPTLDPSRAYAGQELININNLVNGARTKFNVSGAFAGELDSPISWWTNFNLAWTLGRVLNTGDTVGAETRLCKAASTTSIPVSKCEELPAPRIETPLLPGATAVVMAVQQPGARIRIYDASGAEIGNGSGIVINLSRPLAVGDALRVVQELGACRSSTAHLVYVRDGGKQQ